MEEVEVEWIRKSSRNISQEEKVWGEVMALSFSNAKGKKWLTNIGMIQGLHYPHFPEELKGRLERAWADRTVWLEDYSFGSPYWDSFCWRN